jgi:hypothetical protein
VGYGSSGYGGGFGLGPWFVNFGRGFRLWPYAL